MSALPPKADMVRVQCERATAWWWGGRVPDAQPCKRFTLSAAEIAFQYQFVGLERSKYLKIDLSAPTYAAPKKLGNIYA
jgi:hypothetical protein